MSLLELAIDIATKAHEGQVDKGGDPYINHPLRVMNSCDTEETKIIAVLHDVIEDTDITIDYLRNKGFGDNILVPLSLLTRGKNESYMQYIDKISKNEKAKAVKLKDLKDNMNIKRIPNPTEKDFNRLKKYKKAESRLLNS
ncbi:GTP pyrophosphokinase [Clostridium perfringens]|uniref:HD domain-containing protein n=1 Tax=Clostridium perfringens TaxID=1502 RepID=UPI0010391572|nr:HD domain-containing protein [Clostridium perfringens]TBX14335.1 GTP pyrophosphokinase [Clostridium perfringens]